MKKICLVILVLLLLCGCAEPQQPAATDPTETAASEINEYGYWQASPDKIYEFVDDRPVFSLENTFYNASVLVELKTASPAEIYYTTDGSEPDQTDEKYDPEEGIYILAKQRDFPTAYTFKARAYYADGTVSAVAAHTYFCDTQIEDRFTTMVFSITGEASQLTDGPDGIFYGDNCYERGAETEREVCIEAWDADGALLLRQYGGLRIYGGASRGSSIKSMKLYARKRYSSGIGKFRADLFGTVNDEGETMAEYDKLVLRNAGNDFQFGFIRDELCQTLAGQAGFTDYEGVVPAAVYLNGKYYGIFWLHESYCDDYFKEKHPNSDARGEFVVVEGTETWKNTEEDGGDEVYAEEYNRLYEAYAYMDLTVQENYDSLCRKIDVQNYLDYFAFNIYINNNDWPQNNYRCYRYIPAEGEAPEGVYDGRWRYLLHDTDFSFGLYGSEETAADYNNISHILDPDSNRYAPLFAALMHRQDCRAYFMDKLTELAEGALSGENVTKSLYELHILRCTEQDYMYAHMKNLRNAGDDTIWSGASVLAENMDMIRAFANERDDVILSYARRALKRYE